MRLAEMAEGRGAKKIRVRAESGAQLLKGESKAGKKGEPATGKLYERWKAKSLRTVGSHSIFTLKLDMGHFRPACMRYRYVVNAVCKY
jgi:hypothetical protein